MDKEIKRILAVMERASDGGYGIYIPSIDGLTATGDTESEAKANLRLALDAVLEDSKENGIDTPELNEGQLVFEYQYDLSGFFKRFSFFNVSALGSYLGINAGLMRRYKTGAAYISEERKKQIEKGIHKMADELQAVKF